MKSITLPLANNGIAMAGMSSVDDVRNQMGQMLGCFIESHISSASARICHNVDGVR
jgi:hypothetical protein